MADDMETLTHLRAKILGVFGDYWCDHCEERMPDGLLTEGDLRAAFGAHLSAVLAARHDADREDGVWFSPSDLVRHDADIAAAKAAAWDECLQAVWWTVEHAGYADLPYVREHNPHRAALTTGGEG